MAIDLPRLGMLRIGVAAPEHGVADVAFNCEQMRAVAMQAGKQGCRLLLLPELGLTGYSCADLFQQPLLLTATEQALLDLATTTISGPALVIGAPLQREGRLFNCSIFLANGRMIGVVPKTYLPNGQEFYEQRWFTPAMASTATQISIAGQEVPFGTDLIFQASDQPACRLGIELCEDLWSVEPPSSRLALAGATVLLNLSASPETLGKADYRRELVRSQSARCLAAYAYASAGPGESSTDLVFSGHSLIAENGQLLAETERFAFASQLVLADLDLERLENERRRNSSFSAAPRPAVRTLPFLLAPVAVEKLLHPVPATPFVPSDASERSRRCGEIFAIQATGLAKRLRHTGGKSVVLGLSGGLDSTLALLVAIKAFDQLGLDRRGIVTITMPGFGTTGRTRSNAEALAEQLGTTLRVIPIDAAVRQHFSDIGHDGKTHDITYENSQARERTQILMDVANQVNGLVIGTGDLSELALGWCTYNGDHMAMYSVNAGVPKTLVRYLVEWCAEAEFTGPTAAVLRDVAATPVSPELLPPTASGEIAQVTEDHVGPYRLHDFFLYYLLRCQFGPAKIHALACHAFAGEYDAQEIKHWLEVFIRRFFSQQFKRSCLPDGPKVGSVALSPRGDWRMPSDASAALWLTELERIDRAVE